MNMFKLGSDIKIYKKMTLEYFVYPLDQSFKD